MIKFLNKYKLLGTMFALVAMVFGYVAMFLNMTFTIPIPEYKEARIGGYVKTQVWEGMSKEEYQRIQSLSESDEY